MKRLPVFNGISPSGRAVPVYKRHRNGLLLRLSRYYWMMDRDLFRLGVKPW